MNHLRQLSPRVQRGVRGGETVRHKVPIQRTERFTIALLTWSQVSDQNGLVILRSLRKNGCNERDADAPPLVPG